MPNNREEEQGGASTSGFLPFEVSTKNVFIVACSLAPSLHYTCTYHWFNGGLQILFLRAGQKV
jgi:hypothetical protein